VAVAGFFLGGGQTLYLPIFQGDKISLFVAELLAILCMKHLPVWGAIGGANISAWVGYSPP